jgi:transcriptional regulator
MKGWNEEIVSIPFSVREINLYLPDELKTDDMEFQLKTRLDGTIALTSRFHEDASLQRNKSLYKFIWVRHGSLDIEIDHVVMHLKENEIISLSPLHHVDMLRAEGDYLSLLFNSNFYCIYGHDNEVSCNGFLFHGSSNVMRLKLNPTESRLLEHIIETLREECTVRDNLQEEMLRILLKRFIIVCTRMARLRLEVDQERENGFDIIRQFYVLVDNHFKEKKQVQDYAEMLYRSPKTLSNLFSLYGLNSPLRIIHERVDAEARRLLLYTSKSAKEISEILGFEDLATFSRFFKKMNQKSISDFRREEKKEV